MKRFIILIIDGFGIGAMNDVEKVRREDIGANTAISILKSNPDIKLPILEELGLGNLLGPQPYLKSKPNVTIGSSNLLHHGADTFFGHQEIMGTIPKKNLLEPISKSIPLLIEKFAQAGYSIREYKAGNGGTMLILNEGAVVADNVDTDNGQVYNVSAALDIVSFEEVLNMGKILRANTKVPRVIALGGYGVDLGRVLEGKLEKDGGYVGISSPLAGVYDNNYSCVHMGYGVDKTLQLPYALSENGIPSYLVGKAADVIANTEIGESFPMVDTHDVMATLSNLLEQKEYGMFCANVQESDLAGHSEDANKYGKVLEIADKGLEKILNKLKQEDILCVMADHGNDPLIGHGRHTRERVPLMFFGKPLKSIDFGVRRTMADVSKTTLEYFNASGEIEGGTSFLKDILR